MSDDRREDDPPTTQWPAPGAAGGHPFGPVQGPPPAERGRPSIAIALLAIGLVVALGALLGAALLVNQPGPSSTPTAAAGSPTSTASAAITATPPTSQSPGTSESPGTSGSPGASESPRASESPAIGRTPPPDIAAAIEEVIAAVPQLRELTPTGVVPYVLLTRAEAEAELRRALEEEVELREVEIQERLLQRLGLLPDDSDLYSLFEELYTSSVLAYYRPDTDTFYIIEREEPFGPADRMFVAHEYTHALQDQHFDLEGTRITDNAEGDAQLAQLAAVEGDASLLMYVWAFANLDQGQMAELFEDLTPTDPDLLERMPAILRRQLSFPYNEGFLFSNQVFALGGGWDAIDSTLIDPPSSTEQILHPQLYLDGHEPVPVEPTDWLPELGDGWQVAYQQTMGELNTQIWLADGAEPPPIPVPGTQEPWQEAAAGWGGDRLRMYENGSDDWAIVWETAWDSDTDAREFADLAAPLLEGLGYPAFLVDSAPGLDTVSMYIASDEDVLAAFDDLE